MGLFNRLVPRRGDFIVILGMAAVVVLSLLVLLDFQGSFKDGHFAPGDSNVYAFVWAEISTGVVENLLLIEFSTYVDGITVLMLAVVSIVTLMVMIYSVGYMKGEARYGWYFALLSGFGAAMLMLVVSGNLLLLYLSWEAVGLASYLLIGFYWERQTAAEAAKKAFITTRIGDVGLLIGIILPVAWRRFVRYPGDHSLRRSGRLQRHLPDGRDADALRRAPPASPRSSRSTSGCPTRWRAPRPSARSSTPRPWSSQACTWWRG